jgi:hypothetical protein
LLVRVKKRRDCLQRGSGFDLLRREASGITDGDARV